MTEGARHQCLIYAGAPSAYLRTLAATIHENLKKNRRCLYLNSPHMVAGMRSYLAAAGVDVAHEVAKASLVLSSATQPPVEGRFDVAAMLRMLADALKQALADGYDGLWASGDMSWEFGPDRDLGTLLEYEWRLEEFFQQNPAMFGVCQYHTDMLPPAFIRQAVLTHPGLYVNETFARLNPYFRDVRTYDTAAVAAPELEEAVHALFTPKR